MNFERWMSRLCTLLAPRDDGAATDARNGLERVSAVLLIEEEYTIRKLADLLHLEHRDCMQAKLRVVEAGGT